MDVKFINYTGGYPNLCFGQLTLEVNGKQYTFGRDSEWNKPDREGDFPQFWTSGGGISIDPEEIYTEPWTSKYYEDEVKQIDEFFGEGATAKFLEVFNENVSWGCCGGCI